ncbi:hypothetical protein Gotur_030714 [Gossypium turneri]
MEKILFPIRRTPTNSCGVRILSCIKTKGTTGPCYELPYFVKVKGVNVPVTEMDICQIYDVPYYYCDYLYKTDLKEFRNIDTEEMLRFLTEGKEMWTYRTRTTIPEIFNQELMTPKDKMWMKFVCSRIWLITGEYPSNGWIKP